jgi:tetratricopeptide (TPR) repeat protein
LGVLLALGALVAAGVGGYAIWSLLNAPPPGQNSPTENTPQGNQGDPDRSGTIAQTESVEEILGAVQVYVQNKQYDQAELVLTSAVSQYVSDQEFRFALGDLYMLQQKTAQAYDQYIAGIEIGPSSAKAEFTAGTLANMLDQTELAEAHYSASMRMDPQNPDTPIYLAAIQMKSNQLENAKLNLALAGRIAPDRARIYAMRSEIALRENKTSIALEQIRKARGIEPNQLGWILHESRVLKRSGQAQSAVDLLIALPQDQLDNPEVAYILAECFGMLSRPGDAASRLMDVAEKHPSDAKLAFETALWLERAEDRERAIEWAMKAVRLGHPQAQGWIDSLP